MAWAHRILAISYPLLRLRTGFARVFNASQPRLRVLMYHDIAPEDEPLFSAQLRWLQHSWKFLSPDRFSAIVDGREPLRTDSLLLTFDDGFASNRKVAESILNPIGIKAVFFVVSEFVGMSEHDDWRNFVAKNICPELTPELVPDHQRNMTWGDLEYLLANGHTIGAHTASHRRLSSLTGEDLSAEIVNSADLIERRLGGRVDHFAYTFGDVASFSPEALSIARARFRYVYTGVRGNNADRKVSWAVCRDAIKAADRRALVGALLEGGADWRYASSLATYQSWGEA